MVVPKTRSDATRADGLDKESSKDAPANSAPRPLTLAENVILTLKLLVSAGLLGAALWGVNLWTTSN